MNETVSYDIAIIGGGIAGAGAAAMLAPHRRCVLLEMEEQPGHHTTGRSAAMFLLNYGNATIRALTRVGEPYFMAPPAEIAETSLLSRRGHLLLATKSGRERLEALLQEAEDLEEIAPEAAVSMVPILRRNAIAIAAYEDGARDIDVSALHQGWLRACRQAGCEIRTRARVTGLSRQEDLWQVRTTSGNLLAGTIINAAGAWADEVAQMAGVAKLGMAPMRRSIAVVPAPADQDVSHWPLFSDIEETWYAKPDAGQLLVSPADEDPVEPHDAFVDDMVLAEGLHRFEAATTTEVTRVGRTWAGLRTFAPDRTPVVGPDPADPGFFWLAGQGGYGIQTSPAISRLAAALILGQPTDGIVSDATVAALSPTRFAGTSGQSH